MKNYISKLTNTPLITPLSILLSKPPSDNASALKDTAKTFPKTTSIRTSQRRMKCFLAMPAKLASMGTYVGELQELWQFPSDHLPIGITMGDVDLVSWNVLDSEYMNWVTENSQGLSHSMITDEHVFIGDTGLTIRDQHIVEMILQMITDPKNPKSILALQECSEPFLEELRLQLPEEYEIINYNGEILIFDKTRFEIVEAREITGVFSDASWRGFQDITLRRINNGEELRIINAHLPGDPNGPARYEFARYIADSFDPSVATIVMGDMNFNELEMSDAMQKAFSNASPFTQYSPYCTNISPYSYYSKAIDHFFVYSPQETKTAVSSPEEILPGLDETVNLLNNKEG